MDISRFPGLSRRSFLYLTALSAAAWACRCATNPVTGRNQLMLISEDREIQMDRQNSPYQLSADYGIVQDQELNAYLQRTGSRLSAVTHRPHMPYSFQVVNATYVNAYAFPGGTIAATRSILLQLGNEAELAALLGHELGHVNARHTAEIMSKNVLTSTLIGGLAAAAEVGVGLGGVAAQLGMLGSGALLASYSRDNERQADALGLAYLVKGGYGPEGMVGLMKMLNGLSKGHSSAAGMLFATHPMSDERYQTAIKAVDTDYKAVKGGPLQRERYMDHTARLRRIQGAIEDIQKGEAAMAKQDFQAAETHLERALMTAPEDYAGLMLMAKCQLAQEKIKESESFLNRARQVYPQEAQVHYLSGFVQLHDKQFEPALSSLDAYDKRLPGNPNIFFFKGLAFEGLNRRQPAAEQFYKYLQVVKKGESAQYAYQRLVEWDYVKKE